MATPTYEIYALKYGGPFTRPASMVNWFQDMDKNTQINYYIFAIRGEGETIVVDCGVDPQLAKSAKFSRVCESGRGLEKDRYRRPKSKIPGCFSYPF